MVFRTPTPQRKGYLDPSGTEKCREASSPRMISRPAAWALPARRCLLGDLVKGGPGKTCFRSSNLPHIGGPRNVLLVRSASLFEEQCRHTIRIVFVASCVASSTVRWFPWPVIASGSPCIHAGTVRWTPKKSFTTLIRLSIPCLQKFLGSTIEFSPSCWEPHVAASPVSFCWQSLSLSQASASTKG